MSEDKKYTIPYRSQLQEKFEPGQTLIIKGTTVEESQRFTVNFHCKQADFSGNDVPLHISFRFDEGKVVMNSFSKGEWGKEEKKSIPIKRGERFDLRVRAHDNKFQIIIDQKEFKEYEYRLPLNGITHFSVDGDLYLHHIHWGGKYYPVPYETGLANGFPVGNKLLIFATPEKKGRRFNINLLRKNGDIALHFNARFDEKAAIRNALQGGDWGNEEREGKIPFEKGVGFDLVIANEPTQFHITVNDVIFCNFAHRSDPNDITGLQIQGDLEVTGIQIH
ncbi:galactoside-binding lectin domain-containing protein [Ditylenchus destructor]|nr:galactoside-binding lectin domain-containing protein [Ditylenchus destructor]